MNKKPRQKHLLKEFTKRVDNEVKKKIIESVKKPTGKFYREVSHMFDNLNLGDLRQGFTNRTNAKRFSNHKHRVRMGD